MITTEKMVVHHVLLAPTTTTTTMATLSKPQNQLLTTLDILRQHLHQNNITNYAPRNTETDIYNYIELNNNKEYPFIVAGIQPQNRQTGFTLILGPMTNKHYDISDPTALDQLLEDIQQNLNPIQFAGHPYP